MFILWRCSFCVQALLPSRFMWLSFSLFLVLSLSFLFRFFFHSNENQFVLLLIMRFSALRYISRFLCVFFESVCIKADPWIQLIYLHLHVVKTIGLRFEFRFQGMQRQTNEEQTLNDLKQSIQYVVFSLPNSLFEPQPSFIQASSILLGLLSILEHSKGWPK